MKTPDTQLSLFDYQPDTVPDLAFAEPRFSEDIRRVKHNGIDFYSLVDIMQQFTESTVLTQYWRDTKKRLEKEGFETQEEILRLRLKAKDGKQRLADVANAKTCFRILMSIPTPEDAVKRRNLEIIKRWMSGLAGRELDEVAQPSLGTDRALAREINSLVIKRGMTTEQAHRHVLRRQSSIIARNMTTDKLKFHVIDKVDFAVFTNKAEYKPLFDRVAKEICLATGVTDARDGMTTEALAFLEIAELTFSRRIEAKGSITFQEACELMISITQPLGLSIQAMERITGIDIATGKKLLKSQYEWE